MIERLTVVDALEGFQASALLAGLDELGVMEALTEPASPESIAPMLAIDAELLRLCLALVAARTDLVDVVGDRYVASDAWNAHARAAVRQYARAYAPPVVRVAEVLREPQCGRRLVDEAAHAASYAGAPTVASLVADVLIQLELLPTLDVGSGAGGLLGELARRCDGFVGWGVDANPAMCTVAREALERDGHATRATLVEGDAFEGGLRSFAGEPVRSITAVSLLNELWGMPSNGRRVASWVAMVGRSFPGRALIVADYFGKLGHVPPPWPPGVGIHDLVQALTGQGVPPPDDAPWRRAYAAAGADLLHAIGDEGGSWFVHILRLPRGDAGPDRGRAGGPVSAPDGGPRS